MKFPLYFIDKYGGKKPAISFSILAPRIFGQIEAIVDTGSPISLISLKDVIRLNIPANC